MAAYSRGPKAEKVTIDANGYRTYTVLFRVLSAVGDGADAALAAVNLPQPGDGLDLRNPLTGEGTYNPRAVCQRGNRSAEPTAAREGLSEGVWDAVLTFSEKPDRFCQADDPSDPLTKRPEISGSFVRYTEEAMFDFEGQPILNGAHEFIRGPQNEWDQSRGQVKIKQNVPELQLAALWQMMDTVNKYPIWGCPARTVKLSEAPWEVAYCSPTEGGGSAGGCGYYYVRTLVFDVRYRAKYGVTESVSRSGTGTALVADEIVPDLYYDTFDRVVLDEGTKVLNGHWDKATGLWVIDPVGGLPPDPANPNHFIRFKDKNGENARCILTKDGTPANTVVLTQAPTPSGTGTGYGDPLQPHQVLIKYYGESDFSLIPGLPVSLDPLVF